MNVCVVCHIVIDVKEGVYIWFVLCCVCCVICKEVFAHGMCCVVCVV